MLRLTRVKNKKKQLGGIWRNCEIFVVDSFHWSCPTLHPSTCLSSAPCVGYRRRTDTGDRDTQTVTEIQSQIERIGKKTDEGREIIIHIEEERYTVLYTPTDTVGKIPK
jgi:hypothetical protein